MLTVQDARHLKWKNEQEMGISGSISTEGSRVLCAEFTVPADAPRMESPRSPIANSPAAFPTVCTECPFHRFPGSVGPPIPCRDPVKGTLSRCPVSRLVISLRANESTTPAPRHGHQTLPSRNLLAPRQLLYEHAEFGKNSTIFLSRKVSKSSDWEVRGSV